MKLAELITRLPKGALPAEAPLDVDTDIRSIAFLTRESALSPDPTTLYFSEVQTLPPTIEEDQALTCIAYGMGIMPPTLVSSNNVTLIRLSAECDPFVCFNAIQSIFEEDQALASVTHRMMAAHFSNQGLQYLVEEAATALGNPIVVVDPAYRYIAHHLGSLSADDSQLARNMCEEIANESLTEHGIAYIRDQGIDSELARSKGPYRSWNDVLGCNTLTCAVMVRGICVGHVMMMEHRRSFTDLDSQAFAQLAQFVGQELQKSEVWVTTTGELGSYFLTNLLHDRRPSDAVTRRRMKALNFHPKALLFAVVLHAAGEGLPQVQAEHVAAQLRPILHHSVYTRHHQQLVLLLSRDKDEGISERTSRKLKEVATLNGLTVGISNSFVDITETSAAYAQARAAIKYGEVTARLFGNEIIYHYYNISYVHLIELAGRRANLLDFCHPSLIALMRYDERHGSELMDTLYCYLQLAGSTTRASQLLHLHKNTMLYRLGRIREILDLDLASGENLFLLQLSFRILTSLGLFTPGPWAQRT